MGLIEGGVGGSGSSLRSGRTTALRDLSAGRWIGAQSVRGCGMTDVEGGEWSFAAIAHRADVGFRSRYLAYG
jgi:hypothetical protein